jgi:CTP:phosphocholine cytidylyltransferase-like protein
MANSPVNERYTDDMDRIISDLRESIRSVEDVLQASYVARMEDVVYEWESCTKDYIENLQSYIKELEDSK